MSSLQAGQSATVRLRGWSMSPALSDGDMLAVAPVGSALPVVGDVVLIVRGVSLVVHRVVAVVDGNVVTRGDAQDHDDPAVPSSDVLGRVVAHRRLSWGYRGWRRLLRALGLDAL